MRANAMAERVEIMTLEQVAKALQVKLRVVENLRKRYPGCFFDVGGSPRTSSDLFKSLIRKLR